MTYQTGLTKLDLAIGGMELGRMYRFTSKNPVWLAGLLNSVIVKNGINMGQAGPIVPLKDHAVLAFNEQRNGYLRMLHSVSWWPERFDKRLFEATSLGDEKYCLVWVGPPFTGFDKDRISPFTEFEAEIGETNEVAITKNRGQMAPQDTILCEIQQFPLLVSKE